MTMSGNLNLIAGKGAAVRSQDNQHRILRFLHQEKFTTRQILQELLGLKTSGGLWKILSKMEKKNWVKQYKYTSIFTVWGITVLGVKEITSLSGDLSDQSAFMPSRVSLSTLEHSLDIQRVHAMCDNLGLDFQVGRELGSRAEADKVPDAIIHLGGERIAVEVERTLKSTGRYDAIIYNYLKAIKAETYQHVLYVMPDTKRYQQIQRVIFNLGEITMDINGRKERLRLNPKTHLSYFDFVTLNNLTDFLQLKTAQITA